jgi:hypothetical protein
MLAQTSSLQDSITLLFQLIEKAEWWHILLVVLIALGPTLLGMLNQYLAIRRLEKVYEKRITDKDAEIERQAATIKRFENRLLKTKRD